MMRIEKDIKNFLLINWLQSVVIGRGRRRASSTLFLLVDYRVSVYQARHHIAGFRYAACASISNLRDLRRGWIGEEAQIKASKAQTQIRATNRKVKRIGMGLYENK